MRLLALRYGTETEPIEQELALDLDVVVCAPGSEPFARAAFKKLSDPIIGDNPRQLIESIGAKLGPTNQILNLRIFDAFGPNPLHPLSDLQLLSYMRGRLLAGARIAAVVVSALSPGPVSGFGGGGFSGGFSGRTGSQLGAAKNPPWVADLSRVLGIAPIVEFRTAPPV